MLLELKILGIVALSALLGGIVGFDRELADKPAGLRTHMLVAASATLLVSLANIIVPNLGLDESVVRADPIRIIEAVVTGITFLGAGTIIRQQAGIEGLTTAASLLFVAAVGVTVALSQFALALGLVILNIAILRGIKLVERLFIPERIADGLDNKAGKAKGSVSDDAGEA